MKKLIALMLTLVLALSFAACGTQEVPQTTPDSTPAPVQTDVPDVKNEGDKTDAQEQNVLGEGETSFALAIVDVDGNQTDYTIYTDETTVGAALTALELIDGEQGEYGMYIKSVNGMPLDYDKDGKYWAFYIGEEYATTGVDMTPITEGESYTLKAE